ncbi:MAG: rod shape-determining protein RodA [Planctomycetota bacterium]
MKGKRSPRVDWLILGTALALCLVGVIFIASASWRVREASYASFGRQQLIFIAVGMGFLLFMIRFPYLILARFAFVFYAGGLGLLAAVLVIGKRIYGARRWIDLGPVNLQPSELMKIALILALARWLMFREERRRMKDLVVPLALMFVPMLPILKQPDLGTAMTFVPIAFGMMYVAGARLRHLGMVALIGVLAFVPVWSLGLKEYQKDRVRTFVNPDRDPLGKGYQTIQSLLSVGSGGIAGRGMFKGTQNRLNLLPERHTDFIFAVIAEETGLWGTTALLILYILLFVGIALAALRTHEPFGRLVVTGVLILFASQVFVNIGMTIRLMPVTGLTLPFVSYGGSSLVTSFCGLALVMAVQEQQEPELSRNAY